MFPAKYGELVTHKWLRDGEPPPPPPLPPPVIVVVDQFSCRCRFVSILGVGPGFDKFTWLEARISPVG